MKLILGLAAIVTFTWLAARASIVAVIAQDLFAIVLRTGLAAGAEGSIRQSGNTGRLRCGSPRS